MLIVFKSLNGQAPAYIMDMLKIYKPSRNLQSGSKYLLKEVKSHLFLLQNIISGINYLFILSKHPLLFTLSNHLSKHTSCLKINCCI